MHPYAARDPDMLRELGLQPDDGKGVPRVPDIRVRGYRACVVRYRAHDPRTGTDL